MCLVNVLLNLQTFYILNTPLCFVEKNMRRFCSATKKSVYLVIKTLNELDLAVLSFVSLTSLLRGQLVKYFTTL